MHSGHCRLYHAFIGVLAAVARAGIVASKREFTQCVRGSVPRQIDHAPAAAADFCGCHQRYGCAA